MLLVSFVFISDQSRGNVSSVTIIPAAPTLMSTGNYYIPQVQYEFRVIVNDPLDTDRTHYNTVQVTIPLGGGVNAVATWTAPAVANGAGTFAIAGVGGSSIAAAVVGTNVSGTSILDLRFQITFAWNVGGATGLATQLPAGRTISVTATCDSPSTVTNTSLLTYGFCNRVRVFNMSQQGSGNTFIDDGRVSPYHAGNFTVTGTLVFDIPGAAAADGVEARTGNPALVGNKVLWKDTNNDGTVDINTTWTDVSGVDAVSVTGNYPYFVSPHPLGQSYWRFQVALNGLAAGTYTCRNSLPFEVNRVHVSAMTITLGGGRDNAPYHWKSVNAAAVLFTVTATMNGGTMQGNTTITINYNGGTSFPIVIPNGQNTASVIIPAGSVPAQGAGSTGTYQYYVTQISNPSYGLQGTGAFPVSAQIIDTNYGAAATYYTAQTVYWENTHAPNVAAAISGTTPSATSITVYWDHLTDTNTSSIHGDFYEYRVYYSENVGGPFSQWNGANDATLRDAGAAVTNNPFPAPLSDPVRHFDATGRKYTVLPNLKLFTDYFIYVAVVDVFGNERVTATAGPIKTLPFSIEVTITDGIVTYRNEDFPAASAPGDYAKRPLRESNARVDVSIVATSDKQPDSVKVWFTNNMALNIVDYLAVPPVINSGAYAPPNYLESATAQKAGPNKWTAYLPTTSPIIKLGNSVRFIVESSIGSASTFSDIDAVTDQDANNHPWAFIVETRTTFTPWPTRILNNVITNENPVAYPAYYLTEDAYVTIKVYDIKGRPVATILDGAFRKGGQNIKEGGWRGTNKSNKKLGIGLYYIHIRAVRSGGGGVILNKFMKVVMAK